jgi:hypothetical protein
MSREDYATGLFTAFEDLKVAMIRPLQSLITDYARNRFAPGTIVKEGGKICAIAASL